MTQFVRFRVDSLSRFESLQRVFAEIKAVKNLDFAEETDASDQQDVEYDIERMREMLPDDVRSNFVWPDMNELADHNLDSSRPIRISPPGALRGAEWSLVHILDLIDTCEYSLDRCDLVDDQTGELHVETWAYPYGGLNALIALIEGFGFNVVGVNECGKYEAFPDRR